MSKRQVEGVLEVSYFVHIVPNIVLLLNQAIVIMRVQTKEETSCTKLVCQLNA